MCSRWEPCCGHNRARHLCVEYCDDGTTEFLRDPSLWWRHMIVGFWMIFFIVLFFMDFKKYYDVCTYLKAMRLEEHVLMHLMTACHMQLQDSSRGEAASTQFNGSQFLNLFLKSLWLCNLFFHRQKCPCVPFITTLVFCSLLCLFLFIIQAQSKPLPTETEWLTAFKYVVLITIATNRRILS